MKNFIHRGNIIIRKLRIPIGIGTLIATLYFVLGGVFLLPHDLPIIAVRLDGRIFVETSEAVIPLRGQPTISQIKPGDLLLAIDGIPIHQSALRLAFDPDLKSHTYLFQHDKFQYTAQLKSKGYFPRGLAVFMAMLIVILAMTGIGFAIVYYSPAEDELAQETGFVWLGFGLAGAAWWNFSLPGALITFNGLIPILCIGFLRTTIWHSLFPARPGRLIFGFLSTITLVLSLVAILEIILLRSMIGWEFLDRYSLFQPVVLGGLLREISADLTGICCLAAALVLLVLRRKVYTTRMRQRLNILILGSTLGIIPYIIYQISLSTGRFPEAWFFTLPLFCALPAAYAYLVLRRRYISLDPTASRVLQVGLAAVVTSILYTIGTELLGLNPILAPLQPLAGMFILLACFTLLTNVGNPLQRGMEILMFGPGLPMEKALEEFTARLATDPETQTLKKELLAYVPDLLQVQQAALLLLDSSGGLALVGTLNISGKPEASAGEAENMPALLLRQSRPGDPFFVREGWAQLAAPLRIQERTIGLWILGAKDPDGEFDARDASFVRRAATAAAIAAENVRLFEALLDLAQERLRIRQAERQELAARLHDEPLQQAAFLAMEIGWLHRNIGRLSLDQAESLKRQEQEVRALAGTLRDICAGLHPPVLDLGLEPTLREVVENARRRWSGVKIELSLVSDGGMVSMLPITAMDAAYHITIEAITNAAKHAGATGIRVGLEKDPKYLRLTIQDDGCGMPVLADSPSELIRGRHFGLAGMFHWAAVAGGRLEIRPARPQGTRVVLEFFRGEP